MAHIVILGAGIGGMPMAYEMREMLGEDDRVTVVSNDKYFHFVPSNPWVGVNWRECEDVEFEVASFLQKRKSHLPMSAQNACIPIRIR